MAGADTRKKKNATLSLYVLTESSCLPAEKILLPGVRKNLKVKKKKNKKKKKVNIKKKKKKKKRIKKN